MEKPAPVVGTEEPHYSEDAQMDSSRTPSNHSRDVKEKEADTYFNEKDMPAYTDVENQEEEMHLDTAADIVTHVIHLDDDPTINPWTFRMFFLGTVALSRNLGMNCF